MDLSKILESKNENIKILNMEGCSLSDKDFNNIKNNFTKLE